MPNDTRDVRLSLTQIEVIRRALGALVGVDDVRDDSEAALLYAMLTDAAQMSTSAVLNDFTE